MTPFLCRVTKHRLTPLLVHVIIEWLPRVVDTWHSWKSSKVICGPDIWSHRSWIFNNFLKFTFFYFQTLSDAIGSFFSGSSGSKDKGSLISESFSLWLNAQGITLLHTFFLEIWAKVKKFLRLSCLYRILAICQSRLWPINAIRYFNKRWNCHRIYAESMVLFYLSNVQVCRYYIKGKI